MKKAQTALLAVLLPVIICTTCSTKSNVCGDYYLSYVDDPNDLALVFDTHNGGFSRVLDGKILEASCDSGRITVIQQPYNNGVFSKRKVKYIVKVCATGTMFPQDSVRGPFLVEDE
ncbi:MAG: hypothetical protein H7330_00900 [Hymenobacteraceae bacterium]|nr:hypothetical protein [Hymenobacteraceae bacterium]